jgi:DNA end-binding protein Ku
MLFRRCRTLLVRPYEDGLVATTLNFDYEVRSAAEAFSGVPDLKIEGEMLDLAEHIIGTKAGSFAPESFEDRYDAALAELVRAKIEGREIRVKKPAREEKVVDLMAALRESAKAAGKAGTAAKGSKTAAKSRGKTAAAKAAPRRKAG